MVKTQVIPCSKEEIDKIIEVSVKDDFYYMVFNVGRYTGRRIGELWGVQEMKEVGRVIVGKKIEYDEQGKEIALSKTKAVMQRIPNKYRFGVKVQDLDFEKGIMKIWVLKRRSYVQDETILTPELVRIIKHYILKNNLKPEDYLFRAKSYRAIQEAVGRFAVEAGIKHVVSFHNFRHYFVTELKRKGWANDEIMKLTGHKTAQVLTGYDHIVASDIKDKALRDIHNLYLKSRRI
jgi:hypothetical protein